MFRRSMVPRLQPWNVGTMEPWNRSAPPLKPSASRVAVPLFVTALEALSIDAARLARSVAAVIGSAILALAARIEPIAIARIVAALAVAVLVTLIEHLALDASATVRSIAWPAAAPLAIDRRT